MDWVLDFGFQPQTNGYNGDFVFHVIGYIYKTLMEELEAVIGAKYTY